MLAREDADTDDLLGGRQRGRGKSPVPSAGRSKDGRRARRGSWPACRPATWPTWSRSSPTQMHAAAADLQFEVAARLRDEISDLKKELRQMVEANR